jgi:hypothetical protein
MTYLDPLLDRLAAFEPTTLPVLSLYLNTSSDQHGRDDYASFLRKELKAAGTTFPCVHQSAPASSAIPSASPRI